MDWRDLLDERKRRAASGNTGLITPRSFYAPDQKEEEEDDGGFFGGLANIGETVGDIGEGAVGFFGDLVKGVVDPVVGAFKGASEGIAEVAANVTGVNEDIQKTQAKGDEQTQKSIQDAIKKAKDESLTPEQRDRWKKLAMKWSDEQTGELKSRTKELEKKADVVDPIKFAANVGQTGLNFATGGVGAATAKQVIKGGIEQGSKSALKTIGKSAAVNSGIGAAASALEPIRIEGAEAKPEDIWQNALMGGAVGGTLGAAAPLLSKTVRSGLKEIPGEIKQGAAEFKAGFPQGASEAGFIKNPFVTDDAAAEVVEKNAQEMASQYASPEQYLAERSKMVYSTEKDAKGGQLIDTGSPDDPYTATGGMRRISEHAPWYREHFDKNGRAPSQRDTKDIVEQALNGQRSDVLDPEEARVFEILKEREAAFDAQMADPSAVPATQFNEIEASLRGQPAKSPPRIPGGLPRGPGQTAPLAGLAPEDIQPRFNTPEELQASLAAKEAETNPAVDYVDPRATAPPPPAPGAQTALETSNPNPYADMPQDLTRPALPAGDGPQPMTLAEAREHFRKTGETPDFVHTVRETKNPLEMPATVEEGSNIAVRQTKGGKIVPVATNNAHITKDAVDAIRAIANDDASGAFTSTRTPEMNLEEALRKRGGVKSKEFQALNQRNVELREHTADYTKYVDNKRSMLEKIRSEYKLDKGAQDPLMRQFLEAADDDTSKATIEAFRQKYGDKSAEGLARLRTFWRQDNKLEREQTNQVLKTHAGEDRMIGDLGETYLPRVYKNGPKGFKDAILDVSHGGMDQLKSLMNLESPSGYLSNESEVAGTALRSVNQAPLNSNLAKPNTTFLSAAQERTANSPIKDMEDPITSMMRWYDAVGKAKHLTPDIARGRTLQKAIEGVNGETGNLRQMYDSINDQINAIAGKTSSFDTKLVNTETGNKFVNVATKLQSRVARSTILGSAQSAMAQTGQIPLAIAENGPQNWAKGLADMVGHLRSRRDGPIGQSNLMRTRYPDYDDLFTTETRKKAGKVYTNIVAKPFRVIERANSEATWYSSYNRVLGEGKTGKEAAREADRITAKIIGERSPGARAALYESKALGPITSYTLEVNQLYQMGKQYFKRDPKKAAMLVGAIWLYNQGYESLTGNKLNADPIDAVTDAAGILGNQELIDENGDPIGMGERLVRAGGRIAGETVDATPLGSQIAGTLYPEKGFRIPFSGGEKTLAKADIFGGTNFGRYDSGPPIAAGFSNPLLLLGIPGMNQAQKSVEGNRAFNEGGSFAKDGDPKFLIDQNNENYWRSLLWGIYNTPEGQEYLRSQQARVSGSVS